MPRVLSVGQCGYDHGRITRRLRAGAGADVIPADTAREALDAVRGGDIDLVLVNRVFDFDGASGVDLIRRLKADPTLADVPVMLVSNYPDAQVEAESAGALPGFGKADLDTSATLDRVRAAIASRAQKAALDAAKSPER